MTVMKQCVSSLKVMANTIEDLAKLISERDNLPYEESLGLVQKIEVLIQDDSEDMYSLLSSIEDLLESELGLEPDYLDVFGVL
jgi:hypothetical protein